MTIRQRQTSWRGGNPHSLGGPAIAVRRAVLLLVLVLWPWLAASALQPSSTLATRLDPYWFGVLHRAVWTLKDPDVFRQFDDLTRDLVRYRRQEARLDRTCVRDGDHKEMRTGIDRCYEEMQKRATSVWVSIGQVHYVGWQIANGPFGRGDRDTGRQVMKLADQLSWMWHRTVLEATLTRSLVDYPETGLRSAFRSRLNDLFSFYYQFLHRRGEPITVLRYRP